jgi:endonuclease/exonuclease/phosphatase family metal-dependent hydrolase
VRVATFNILHGLSLADGRVDVSRLAAAVRILDVDVLAMQEVDQSQPRSLGADLTAAAAEAMGATAYRFVAALIGTPGGSWQTATGEEPAGRPGYGIALLSRHQVSDWQVVRLPASPMPIPIPSAGRVPVRLVRDEPRVAVGATVHTPDGRLRVVTTHLTYMPAWNVGQLRRVLQAVPSSTDPLLLLGDLNMGPSVAGAATGLRSLANQPTFPSYAPRRQLDHILARGLAAHAPADVIPLPLSDHHALTVDVCFTSECALHRS